MLETDAGVFVPAPSLCDGADDALIACFAFEGTPNDGSANAFEPSVAEGLGYALGRDGMALAYGATSSLSFPHDPRWAAPAMSYDVWINPASLPQGTARAAILDSTGKPSLFLLPGGVVRCFVGVEQVASSVVAGEWTHIACLSDGTTQSMYVNGVEVDRRESIAVLMDGTQPIHIGADEPTFDDKFDGLIDSLRVWARTLSPKEICAAAGRDGC